MIRSKDEQMKVMKAYVSRAHDWLASLPVADNNLICSRCGITTHIGRWDVELCIEHVESNSFLC